jgi:WD40 repeat protein
MFNIRREKKMRNHNLALLIIITLTLLPMIFSCDNGTEEKFSNGSDVTDNSDEDIPGTPPQGHGVYISGAYEINGMTTACYWKIRYETGNEQMILKRLYTGDRLSEAYDIVAGEKGIYVAGYYWSGEYKACYWVDDGTNIIKKDLSMPQDGKYSQASSVCLSSNGLYFAGYMNIENSGNKACYWDNKGDIYILPISDNSSQYYARDIAVDSNGIVYIVGDTVGSTAYLWIVKNGEIKTKKLADNSNGNKIIIDSPYVYIGGHIYNKGTYWKIENEAIIQTKTVSGINESNINSMALNNFSNIYCAGDYDNDTCFWDGGNNRNTIILGNNENSSAMDINIDSINCIHIIATGGSYSSPKVWYIRIQDGQRFLTRVSEDNTGVISSAITVVGY